MNSKEPNRRPLTPFSVEDERVLDALLGEIEGTSPSPTDLADSILRDLARKDWSPEPSFGDPGQSVPAFAVVNPRKASAVAVKNRSRHWMLIAAAVLAASVLLLLPRWWSSHESTDPKVQIANNQPSNSSEKQPRPVVAKKTDPVKPPVAVMADDQKKSAVEIAKSTTNREVLPLGRNDEAAAVIGDEVVSNKLQPTVANSQRLAVDETKLLATFNESLAKYWQRVGVTPAALISDAELAARIESRFAVHVNLSSDKGIHQTALSTDDDCRPFAKRVVDQLFRDVTLIDETREKMVDQAAAAIASGQRFDELVSRWIADEQLFDSSSPEYLSQGLANNLLNGDAACARCHDSPVDGSFAQHDYWSLAAIFTPKDRGPLFYELPDGRQHVAEPQIPTRWLGELSKDAQSENGSSSDLRQKFAHSLIGNRRFAEALANRLWEIGFGAPLVSRASDPIAPPRDEALQRSHATIADALINSNFDLRVAARMVMASDAMRRGQSELYASGRWRVANEQAISQDALALRTFAAAPPTRPRVDRDKLIAMMESRIGGIPRALEATGTVLAQPINIDDVKPSSAVVLEKPSSEEYLWASWIADRESLHDSWLHWIKDAEQQQRHAVYAANRRSVAQAAAFAQRLTSTSDDSPVAMENANDRLLWVLRQTN